MAISLRRYAVDDVSSFNGLSAACRRYTQIGRGAFRGKFNRIEMNSLSVLSGRLNDEIVGCINSARATLFISMPLADGKPARFNGWEVTAGDLIFHWGQEAKLWHTTDDFKFGVIELPAPTAPDHMPFRDPVIHADGSGALTVRHPAIEDGLRGYVTAARAIAERQHP